MAPPQSLISKYALPTVQTRANENDLKDYILQEIEPMSKRQNLPAIAHGLVKKCQECLKFLMACKLLWYLPYQCDY